MNFETVDETQEILLRTRIIAEAHKLLNVKFAHRGRTRHGLDCAGFVYLSYRRANIDVPSGDGRIYEPTWYMFVKSGDQRYLNNILKYFRYIDTPKIGDLLSFKFHGDVITHTGILDKNNQFIHAESGRCVKLTDLNHRFYKNAFYRYLRHQIFVD